MPLHNGILLAVGSAVLCGWADVCAAQSAKRLGAVTTTFLALVTGVLAFVLLGMHCFPSLGLTVQALVGSLPFGLGVGALAALGYSSGYRGLSLGPLAIVGPIVGTDGAVAGGLCILLLHERVDMWQAATLAAVLLGILLASASWKDLTGLRRPTERKAFSWRGVPWGLLSAVCFGAMLFALAAGSHTRGWYLSLLWSRLFAAVLLAAAVGRQWLRQWRRPLADGERPGREHRFRLKAGPWLAVGGGVCETAGLALFSLGAQTAAAPAIVSMVASTFTLIPVVFGVLCLSERPAANQWLGISLVVVGVILLGITLA